MVAKHQFSRDELTHIFQYYNLGRVLDFTPFNSGTVQTNIWIQTTLGQYVFRYYENRTTESVLFEVELLRYLKESQFPCPAPYIDNRGQFVGIYELKPYVVFEYMEGEHIQQPNKEQMQQLIQKVAELHITTENYLPRYKENRWNYSAELCRDMAEQASQRINTESSRQKLSWLETELRTLELPKSLPKGICHSDFNFSNVLFNGEQFCALLDFDDANYTYLLFDLIGLIESRAWRHDTDKVLNFDEAKRVVSEYINWKPLREVEQQHLFDVYKLSILIDCVWYFERGDTKDFYEKRKVDFLNTLGREQFFRELFG